MKKILFLIVLLTTVSCSKSEDSYGYEYVPDMYLSPAIEADRQNSIPPLNTIKDEDF